MSNVATMTSAPSPSSACHSQCSPSPSSTSYSPAATPWSIVVTPSSSSSATSVGPRQVADRASSRIPSAETGSGLVAARRSKSVSFAPSSRYSNDSEMSQVSASPSRVTLSSASPSANARRAQLALLAEQASLASVGTSNLKVARATSLVMDEAVRRAMSAAANGQVPAEADVPHIKSSSASNVGRRTSTSSNHSDGKTSSSNGSSPKATADSAWEQTFSASDFLSSASSLAHSFQVQEQSRKDWAGQALALQRRRWTMAYAQPLLPSSLGDKGKRRAVDAAEEEDVGDRHENTDSTMADVLPAEESGPSSSVAAGSSSQKRRRTVASSLLRGDRDRRVSFAANVVGGTGETEQNTKDRPSPLSFENGNKNSMSAQAAAGLGSAPVSPTSEARPQLLANVLASFETLMDSRSQACAGLAELARSADEMETFRTGGAVFSTQSSRASSPKASESGPVPRGVAALRRAAKQATAEGDQVDAEEDAASVFTTTDEDSADTSGADDDDDDDGDATLMRRARRMEEAAPQPASAAR